MFEQGKIEIENRLSKEMLQEAALNSDIKQVLKEIAEVLLVTVLKPIQDQLKTVTQFSDLPKEIQELIANLAAEHSSERRQYGAALPEFSSSKEILNSIDNIKTLLEIQVKILHDIGKVSTIDEMAVALKIIVELGYTHYEAPKKYHGTNFDAIDELIAPTREEIDIRLFRSEVGEPAVYALTYGIGTADKDLGLQAYNIGRLAGKSVFCAVSMKKRLELLCNEYDKTKEPKYQAKMEYYKIPLNPNDREPLAVYAKKWETFFEKLIKDPKTQTSMPLIASVSRATARLIVTLQDLSAFNKPDKSFDFDKAQIVANCIMGFIVHAGHHSIVEVAEVYNRLIDYVALDSLEKNGPMPDMIEEKLPYYRLGNYHSFFNKKYADKMITPESSHYQTNREFKN